jgi:magnesium chelatase family protein
MGAMLVTVPSFVLQGIDAVRCDVEVSLQSRGLPRIALVGLPDLAVRESVERVRSAMEAGGFEPPRHRTTISLAPADLRKQGTAFDLPIAVALLLAGCAEEDGARGAAVARRRRGAGLPEPPQRAVERKFPGDHPRPGLRPVRGVVGMALLARRLALAGIVVPAENAPEAAVVEGIDVRGARGLTEVVAFFRGAGELERAAAVDVRAAVAAGCRAWRAPSSSCRSRPGR